MFTGLEINALARLVYKRFGKDDDAFVAAWARMHQQVTPDRAAILALLKDGRAQERRYLKDDLMRDGVMEMRSFRADLLDVHSCEVLRRHLCRIKSSAEQMGRRRQAQQPWRRP